ncbi:hypothetical protein [Streptosporangium sp. NBC_01756]|uniref:hypothetical protein n=1 Tax=Streptosporangium sp. NBC_01756 TaxID=2975950 RepID=UPI002DDBEBD5|nr:hypothetical protein [Streptosporangium sp. NBC_01756]WSC83759.1 hypothetical protein OIE48_25535 [Streptosporangium sp. NBC_01756]
MPFPVARSRDEAHLYLDLHPCGCGSADTTWESALANAGGEPVSWYTGVCPGCGTEREFLFGLPEREVASVRFPAFGGPEPSQLLDAGEWLWVADLTAGNVPVGEPGEALQALTIAMAAIEEVMKFVSPGQEEVSDGGFWSERGQRVRAAAPGRFRLNRLLVVRNTYRDLAARQA